MLAIQDGHMVQLGSRRLCVADRRKDAGDITIRYNAHDDLLTELSYIDGVAPDDAGMSDDEYVELTITVKGLRDLRAAIRKAQGPS